MNVADSIGATAAATANARAKTALELPFGAWGVAGIGAVALGLVGLALPTSFLESLSFQLYLDTILAAAKAPLGQTAKLLFALGFAGLGGLIGYALARLFRVRASAGGFAGLMERLRGGRDDDEADAPSLRAADRHPDAPARRPFSAARDIPERGWFSGFASGDDSGDGDDAQDLAAIAKDGPISPAAPASFIDGDGDDDELLLDGAFFDANDQSDAGQTMHAAPQETAPLDDDLARFNIRSGVMPDDMDGFDIPAPRLTDWDVPETPVEAVLAPQMAEPQPTVAPVAPAAAPVVAAEREFSPMATPATMAIPPHDPLDLSAARLEDLLARLESGLSRRTVAPEAAVEANVPEVAATTVAQRDNFATPTGADLPAEALDQPDKLAAPATMATGTVATEAGANDPAFPHDPALAAALATLRRLNQRAS